MISKCLIVILLVNAISCGKHGLRAGLPFQEPTVVSNVPMGIRGQLPQTVVFQQIERNAGIPSTIGSSLPATNFQVPQTIPQYLLSLPRMVDFQVPQSIPIQLLTITAPGAVPQSFAVQPVSPAVSRTPLVSPAQKVRTHPIPVASAPIQTPVIPESASIPRFESNAYSGSQNVDTQRSAGFSTPLKPLNFAPILPEVNGQPIQSTEQIAQRLETPRTEQIPEPVEQRIETPQVQEPVQEVTQQRIETLPQPITQQRTEQLPQPLTQQRVDTSQFRGQSSAAF